VGWNEGGPDGRSRGPPARPGGLERDDETDGRVAVDGGKRDGGLEG
jgi:hypothetical protein